ncbi:hypothetical protein B0H11DRAFT_2075856 [Mycena galericulata]|nr:hypothetical protein B0H11DRAFT_2075856 [Mycena galericulata]
MSSLTLPTLPVELEKEIFEIAAYSRPLCIPKLMLVAWRVKIWVKPLLYRIVVLLGDLWGRLCLDAREGYPYEDDQIFTRIRSTPTSVFRNSVRHLCLNLVSNPVVEFILTASSGLEDLWILQDGAPNASLLPIIGPLPLKRLHCRLEYLFTPNTQIDFTHPLFSHLTHLELFTGSNLVLPELWSGLALIPCLTHLSFNYENFLHLSPMILNTCKFLRVLAFMMVDQSEYPTLIEDHPELKDLAKDPRFVQMACCQYIKDWQMGALTGVDYWSRAEEFIAKRKSGEIDPLQYLIEVDESKNLV